MRKEFFQKNFLKEKKMKIKLIPEKCDEETIATIRMLKTNGNEDELLDFIYDDNNREFILDALYYASDNGEWALQDQEKYFTYALRADEFRYFVWRTGFDEEY